MELEKQNKFLECFKKRGIALLQEQSAAKAGAVLVSPAETITPALMNELLSLSGGLTFVALTPSRTAAFVLSKMARPQTSVDIALQQSQGPNFCISVDAREGISTGISAADRAKTIKILGEKNPNPRSLVKPGHVFPIEAAAGGTLVRNALPEGALDLVIAAGYTDAALYIDLLNHRGQLMTNEEQIKFAAEKGIPAISLAELISYRLNTERLVSKVAAAKLPTAQGGEMRSYIYKSKLHGGEHLALVKGEIDPDKPVLVRVQTEATFSDVFGGDKPPSRRRIEQSFRAIADNQVGVFLYLRKTSPGHLKQQIETCCWDSDLQGMAMLREYGLGAQILYDLGVRKIELLTNNSKNMIGLKAFGIEIVSQKPFQEKQVSEGQS